MTIPVPSNQGWATGFTPSAAQWAASQSVKTDAITWGAQFVTPQQFDPSAGIAGHDCTSAINSAEACLGPGGELHFPAGVYDFSSTLTSSRQQLCWSGAGGGQSILHYNGGSTTIDLIHISNVVQASMTGLKIRSATLMTAGSALHLDQIGRSVFNLTMQSQDDASSLGNNLFHGIWFDKVENCVFGGSEIGCQGDGIRVNGDTAMGGGNAGLTVLDGLYMFSCGVGIRCGGAFGGLYIQCVEFDVCASNIIIDQTLAAQQNREIFLNGTISDKTVGGAGFLINDPGAVVIQCGNCWFSAADTHGVWVAQNAGRILFTGCRFVGNGGDGIRVDAAGAQVSIVGGASTDNTGYGINPNVASNTTTWDAVNLMNNTLGPYNPAHPGSFKSSGYAALYQVLEVSTEMEIGDANFFMELNSGTPIIAVDALDFYQYDRSGNHHQWLIGGNVALDLASAVLSFALSGTVAAVIDANGLVMTQNLPIKSIAANVAGLPAAATVGDGARCYVPDSTLAYLGVNIGTAVVGGGTHGCPVVVVGGVWVIG